MKLRIMKEIVIALSERKMLNNLYTWKAKDKYRDLRNEIIRKFNRGKENVLQTKRKGVESYTNGG